MSLISPKLIFLIGLGFVWSLRVASVKHAVENGVSPHVIIEFAMLGIATVMLSILFASKQKLPLTKQAIGFYLITLCLLTVTGVEKPKMFQVVAILIGFAAALLIIFDGVDLSTLSSSNLTWVAIAFCIPLLYALNTTYVAGKWPSYINPLQVAAGQALCISIAIIIASPFSGLWSDVGQIGMQPWPFVGILVSECLGLFLYFALIRSQGAAYMIMANYVAIAFGALGGVFFFDETIGVLSLIAAIILGGAIYLAQRRTTASGITVS